MHKWEDRRGRGLWLVNYATGSIHLVIHFNPVIYLILKIK